jgi:PAS domain S-box-containing protein
VYHNGSVSDYEVVLKRKDGSPVYVSTNSHLYYHDDGELLGVEGIFRDISDRHATTEKIQNYITTLKESEEIFSSVAQYAPFPIAIVESDGSYRYINQKFVETFGYDLNDFKTGSEWFSLAYPDPIYRKKVIDTWKSDLEASVSGIERPEKFTVRCKNGVDREIVFHPVSLSDKKQCIVYEDLTDQYKAAQMEKLFSLIVETTSDAITGEKIDGTIISMNPAAEHLYGYSKDELVGRNISQIIPKDRQDESNRIFEQINKREAIKNFETRRVRKDGRVVDVEVTISPITDENSMVIGASTIARDISLKKSEERLRESEEKYRIHVENMNVGIYRSTGDPRGRFVWGNSSLVEILGYPSFEILRQIAVADIFTEPDGRKKLLDDLQRFGFVKNRKIHLIRDDGTKIWVSITALAKFDQDGNIEFINGIVEDVTRKKEILPQCQTGSDVDISLTDAGYPVFPDYHSIKSQGLLSPNYLSSALKMARDYIAILDRSGKCLWVNDALADAVNAESCNDLAGRSIALYIAPEFRKMALDSLGEVKKNGHKTVPFMMLSSSGRIQVEANISAITTEEGDLFGYMAIARHVEGKKPKNHNGDNK